MARTKRKNKAAPRRESPVQFRPSGELSRLLDDFAGAHKVSKNEACRHLIALALVGLDARHYPAVREMATGATAGNVTQACLHLHAALGGAARLEGEPLVEPRRAAFVVGTICDALAAKNRTLDADCSAFLPRTPEAAPQTGPSFGTRVRRTVLKKPPEAGELSEGESALGSLPDEVNNGSVPQRVDG